MARITRKELKTDKFALEVEHTVTFFEEHRGEIVRYGPIVAAVVLLVLGFTVYRRHQHTAREEALSKAIQVQETAVSDTSTNGVPFFPTQEAKDQASLKAFSELQARYPGSSEGEIAEYYLGAIQADQGKLAEAEKSFLGVAEKGDARYSSLAKLSLAQIYFAQSRADQGEKVLRDLMAHPTIFVSREQAAIMLAGYVMPKNPAEARKLLDPLRDRPGAVSQVALGLYGELPPQ